MTTTMRFLLWLAGGMVGLLNDWMARTAAEIERQAHPIEHAGYVLYLDTMAEHGQRDIALGYASWLHREQDEDPDPEVEDAPPPRPLNPRRTMPIEDATMVLSKRVIDSATSTLRYLSLNRLEELASRSLGPVDPRLIGRIGGRPVFRHDVTPTPGGGLRLHSHPLHQYVAADQKVLLDAYRRIRNEVTA
jgi:hypothetical protein